jgi:lysophospholipase L1-like esterase
MAIGIGYPEGNGYPQSTTGNTGSSPVGGPTIPVNTAVTLPLLQSAYDSGTPTQQIAFSSSVQGTDVKAALRVLMATARQDQNSSTPASPPTLSVSVGDLPTVLLPVYIAQNTAFTDTSVPVYAGAVYPDSQVTYPRYYSDGSISATPLNTGNVVSYFLATDDPAPEIRFKNFGVKVRIWYTEGGKRYYGGEVIPTYDSALHYLRINFGTAVLRTVEVETLGAFGQWAIGANSSYFKPSMVPVTGFLFGDSFTEGTGAPAPTVGWAAIFAKLVGLQRYYVSGLGGTGYGMTNGSRANLLGRLQTDCINLLPAGKCVIFHANGINDTLAQVQTNAPQIFDQIFSAKPDVLQVVFDAFSPRSVDNSAKNAALAAMVATRKNMIYVPTLNEIWGTGYGGTGTGNSKNVIGGIDGTDPTHPTPAGHVYLARARAEMFAKALG